MADVTAFGSVEEFHPEATYYKRVKREGKWGWESVGNDANTACSKMASENVSYPVSTKAPEKTLIANAFDEAPERTDARLVVK